MRQVQVVGFGMGPHHLTREAEQALGLADFVVAFRKGGDDPLLEVRARIAEQFGLKLVEVEDPERDRAQPADYPGAVRAWHEARTTALLEALRSHEGVPAVLVWGDPSLYDSTLRLLEAAAEQEALSWRVVPGISAPQVLAARHGVVLHEVGAPVHVTTARRLREAVDAGERNIVVMLGSGPEWVGLEDWHVWWGANLGTTGERVVSGRVGAVADLVATARAQARREAGWVMDAYLLRAPADRSA